MNSKLIDQLQHLRNEMALITINDTLDAFSNEYCDLLELSNEKYIERKVSACLKDLEAIKGIDYDDRVKSAYDSYNEAVVYYELHKKCSIVPIPEEKYSTPDFVIPHGFSKKVYLEVKSLAFAGGNVEYKKGQNDALYANIKMEQQVAFAKQHSKQNIFVASSEREVCPLGHGTLQEELNEILKKIDNNYKSEQFCKDNTIIGIDLNQIWLSYKKEDCRAIAPSFNKLGYTTGMLWAVACGKRGDSFYVVPEFEGKPNIDKQPLMFNGILHQYPSIKAVMFFLGRKPDERCCVGFYRCNESDSAAAQFIKKVCVDYNDDRNSNCI